DPRPGTPLADLPRVTPQHCLRVLSMFRFLLPRADLRVAGGREVNLRWLQPFALYAVNSIFTSGDLTTPGATPSADHQMIRDLGFEIEEVGSLAERAEARRNATLERGAAERAGAPSRSE